MVLGMSFHEPKASQPGPFSIVLGSARTRQVDLSERSLTCVKNLVHRFLVFDDPKLTYDCQLGITKSNGGIEL
jgi:hypothetical protein